MAGLGELGTLEWVRHRPPGNSAPLDLPALPWFGPSFKELQTIWLLGGFLEGRPGR